MNFFQESQVMWALYDTQTKGMKGFWYEYLAEHHHRVVVDYLGLGLSTLQEKRLRAALEGAGEGLTCEHTTGTVHKDERSHITLLDFRNKASAHHFLLVLETKLSELERADFLRCQEMKKARQQERLQRKQTEALHERRWTKAVARMLKSSSLLSLIFFNKLNISQQDKCPCMTLIE